MFLDRPIVHRHTSCRMPGAFGVVSFVREWIAGKSFAMKQVRLFVLEQYVASALAYPVTQDGYVEKGSPKFYDRAGQA